MAGIDILRSRLNSNEKDQACVIQKSKVFQMREKILGEEFYENVDVSMLSISMVERYRKIIVY
jgi:hypothetical protein